MVKAHLIVRNARTGRGADHSLAVWQNRILAVGHDAEIATLQGERTKVINAGGRLLLPGLIDSHTHFLGYIKRKQEVRLENATTLSEALQRIRLKVKETPPGGWVTGGGWNRNAWPAEDHPDRHQLDEISTRHFIALDSKDWHTMWVNTPVLELTGISPVTPYPGARHLAIHPRTGQFTGVLEEDARTAVFGLVPNLSYPETGNAFRDAVEELHKLGITAIHSMETPAEFRFYRAALADRPPGLRVFWYPPVRFMNSLEELGLGSGFGSDNIRIAGVKIFVDGAFGSQTAELLQNYRVLGHAGVEVLPREQLRDLVASAVGAGLSCAVHAIGDRAVRKTLDVFGEFSAPSKEAGLQHRIEHAQLIHPEDLPRFARYGVTASVQPAHLPPDIPVIQKYLGNRARYTYPFRSLVKSGARLIFGSDTPIESFNPWQGIYSALVRPDGKNRFFPKEALDVETCLAAYTINSARAVRMENRLGTLQPEMLADFFVPNRDPFAIPAAEIPGIRSLLTVADGRVVYREIE